MRTYRPSRRGRRGARIAYERWYVELRDHRGVVRRIRGFTDRAATEALGRDLERLAEFREATLPPDRDLARAIEGWPELVRERCVEIGLLDPVRAAATRPLDDILLEWRESIETRERTDEHVERRIRHATRLFAACGFRSLADIRPAMVETTLRALRDRDKPAIERYVLGLGPKHRTVSRERDRLADKGLGIKASNHVQAAVRQFTRWAAERGYLPEDPLRTLKPLNARLDRRRVRRALSVAEICRVVQAAHDGSAWRGVDGPTRALVYVLATETGLRYREIGALRVASFDLADPKRATVELPAAETKNREDAQLPLRSPTALALARHLAGRGKLERAFQGLPAGAGAAMLVHDLEAASTAMKREDPESPGIPYRDESGRVADFHALRGQAATHALAAGASPKVAQTLLRHSSPGLTLGLYARLRPGEERDAVERLPEILPVATLRATGTAATDATSHEPEHVASSVAFRGGRTERAGALDSCPSAADEPETALVGAEVVTPRGFEPLSPG